jgi:hypothetical protein
MISINSIDILTVKTFLKIPDVTKLKGLGKIFIFIVGI